MKIFGLSISDIANWMTILVPVVSFLVWLFSRKLAPVFWQRGKIPLIGLSLLFLLGWIWRVGWFRWVSFPIPIPLGLLVLACLVVISSVGILILLFLRNSKKPDFKIYRSDTIFGIRWNWEYHYGRIEPSLINAFCPERDCCHRLDIAEHSGYAARHSSVDLSCPRCDFRKQFDETSERLMFRVAGEIERRINTEEYLRALR